MTSNYPINFQLNFAYGISSSQSLQHVEDGEVVFSGRLFQAFSVRLLRDKSQPDLTVKCSGSTQFLSIFQ